MTTTTAPTPASSRRYGNRLPRVGTTSPPADDHAATELVAGVHAMVGHQPMPWQDHVYGVLCGKAGGRWVTRQAGIIVSRQNGKTDLVGARIIAGTRFLGERVLYTTHSNQAAVDLWRRITGWVDDHPWLRRRVTDIKRSNGRERLAFRGGGVLQIATSGGRPPRGFDKVDLLIFDEARELTSYAPIEAVAPTQTAARDPQRLYLSNAGSLRSVVLNALRDAGRSAAATGEATHRAWLEWSAPPGAAMTDPNARAQANPALGYTITDDYLDDQLPPEMTEAGYRTEHMCQWVASLEHVIEPAPWARLEDPDARPTPGHCVITFDVDKTRIASAVGIAWRDDAGLVVGLLEYAPTASWLPDAIAEAIVKWRPRLVAFDRYGPAGDVADVLTRRGVDLAELKTDDVTAGSAAFLQGVVDATIRHTPAPPLDAAATIAGQRYIGQRWTWDAPDDVSIAALRAATFAAWAYDHTPPPVPAPVIRGASG